MNGFVTNLEDRGSWQKCPVCDGTGLVSRPPLVPGDQKQWTDGGSGGYVCNRCSGTGTIWNGPSQK